jgi:protein SCO1/2
MIGRVLSMALACLVAGAAFAHVGPHPEAGIAFDQRLGARVDRSLAFTDARGTRETLSDAMHGVPTVLMLGYLKCEDLCSVALPGAAEALARTGLEPAQDVRAIFASIHAREGADVLSTRAARLPVAQRAAWTFLGDDGPSAQALARSVGFHYRYEKDRDAFAHPEGIVVLSPNGLVSRYLFGVRFDPTDLRLAIAEAGQGRTGRLSDRLLLLCYHFDPATGKYTARVLDAVRGAIAVFAVLALGLAWRGLRRPRLAERMR